MKKNQLEKKVIMEWYEKELPKNHVQECYNMCFDGKILDKEKYLCLLIDRYQNNLKLRSLTENRI